MAYVLLCALRRIALNHTPFAKATCGTIRLKLLKIGALVRISVRRIKIAMASGCPAAQIWGARCHPPRRRCKSSRLAGMTGAAAARPIARHKPTTPTETHKTHPSLLSLCLRAKAMPRR